MTRFGLVTKNLRRNTARTLLTILAGGIALVAFVLLRTVVGAFRSWSDFVAQDRLVTRHRVASDVPVPRRYVELIKQVPGVAEVNYGIVVNGKDPKDPRRTIAAVAVEPTTLLSVHDEMEVPEEQVKAWLANRSGVLLGDRLAAAMNAKMGDRITVETPAGNYELTVEGVYGVSRPTYPRTFAMFHYELFNQQAPAEMRDMVRRIVTRVDDPARTADVASAVDEALREQPVPVITQSAQAESLAVLGGYSAILTSVNVGTLAILSILLLVLANTIAMGVRERTQELGVLRSIGFSRGAVLTMLVGEAVLIGVFTSLVAIALSYPLINGFMRQWLEVNTGLVPYFRVKPLDWVLTVGAAILGAAVAALIPAINASRLRVTDALRHVE